MRRKQQNISKFIKTPFYIILILTTFVIQSCINKVNKCPYELSNLRQKGNSTEFRLKGIILRQNGELDKAIDEFTKVICLDPNFAEAYYERGLIYRDLGELSKAVKNLEKANTLYQKSSDPKAEAYLISIKNALDKIKR